MKSHLILILASSLVHAAPKEIALSFDDAPRRLTGNFTAVERSVKLVNELKKAKVKEAVFYCNSAHINPGNEKSIQIYNDAGFTISNHTHSHPNFNEKTFELYYKDFLLADMMLSKYSHFKKFFRFPYLREGNDESKRDRMRQALSKHGYINGYITVDFNDWHLEALLREALESNQQVDLEALRRLYLDLAKQSLNHYDTLAIKYLGRSPKHVLLLHETDLAALFIQDLIKAMRQWNWKIISSEEAYSDEISRFSFKKALKYNPGRVGEIALQNGHPVEGVWHPDTEPEVITQRFQREVVSN